MKGNKKVIETLNNLLADELTAINQYMVHAKMCGNWGYEKLYEITEKRAIQEMKHAEDLIARILFLGGTPIVNVLNKINIGKDVPEMLKNDRAAEEMAIVDYNKAVALTADEDDNGSSDLVATILLDEEAHINWIESQLAQIEQMGVQNYLVEQLG